MILLIIILVNVGGKASSNMIIPEDAIRYRVIANSNTKEDQQVKLAVRDALTNVIDPILLHSTTKQQVKAMLQENEDLLNQTVSEELKKLGVNSPYSIDYGSHYFPEKEYQGVTYQEGNYESLVVTLGKGEGENFWCVLFPPLCLLEGEKTESEKVEYTSFIQQIIKSLFK